MLSAQIQMIRLYTEVLIARVKKSDLGMTTETAIITAILAGAAIALTGAIVLYVKGKQDDIADNP